MSFNSYANSKGQTIYSVDGANYGQRSIPGDVQLAVIHFTEGRDSRGYLRHNPSGVSTTYLIGSYPKADPNDSAFGVSTDPTIYKFCSETIGKAYTQGYGVLGMLGTYDHQQMAQTGVPVFTSYRNPNDVSLSFEIEGTPDTPPSAAVLDAAAVLIASVIEYWAAHGKQLLVIGHMHIDSEKNDPQTQWGPFVKLIYSKVVF